jgi:Protein of unknown function (DUF3489)
MTPMNASPKLTDTQLGILAAASQREDHCLIAPKNLKGGAAQKVAAKLLAARLAREIGARGGMPVWRRDEETGKAYSLKMTTAGLNAIVVDEGASHRIASSSALPAANEPSLKAKKGADKTPKASATAAPTSSAPRVGTKIAHVIELLQRDQGAKLDELTAATGWLPHTARAALTGLRHRGYEVRLERGEKGRASVYRALSAIAIAS